MITKHTRKFSIVAGIRNAMGYGKRRGGAGAVAAALAACFIISCLAVSTVHGIPIRDNHEGEVPEPVYDTEPPIKIPITEEPKITYNGATPQRLPW